MMTRLKQGAALRRPAPRLGMEGGGGRPGAMPGPAADLLSGGAPVGVDDGSDFLISSTTACGEGNTTGETTVSGRRWDI
jgi:hypothetical protein